MGYDDHICENCGEIQDELDGSDDFCPMCGSQEVVPWGKYYVGDEKAQRAHRAQVSSLARGGPRRYRD